MNVSMLHRAVRFDVIHHTLLGLDVKTGDYDKIICYTKIGLVGALHW